MRRRRWIITALVVLAAAYWTWPFIGAAQIVRAARSGDSAAVIARVDLPALRRNLARQLAIGYLNATGKAERMGSLGRGIAGAAATTMADPYLAELLTPENITALLGQGRIGTVKLGTRTVTVGRDLPGFTGLFNANWLWLLTGSYFDGPRSFVIPATTGRGDEKTGSVETYDVHLRLTGATWLLSGIDLPTEMVNQMARQILNKPEQPEGEPEGPKPESAPSP